MPGTGNRQSTAINNNENNHAIHSFVVNGNLIKWCDLYTQ